MINSVQSTNDLNNSGDDRRRGSKGDDKPAKASAQPTANTQPEVRLVIEEDKSTGGLVYKLIDRFTRQVVSQTSREDLVKMGQDPDYTAGKVISTKA